MYKCVCSTQIFDNGHLAKADCFLLCIDSASLTPRVSMLSVVLLYLTYPGLLLARLYYRQQNTWIFNALSGQEGEAAHFFNTVLLLLESIFQISKAPLCFAWTWKAVCCSPRVIMMKIAPKLLNMAGTAVSCKWRCVWKIPVIPVYYTNGPRWSPALHCFPIHYSPFSGDWLHWQVLNTVKALK